MIHVLSRRSKPTEHKGGARMGNVVVIEITDRGIAPCNMMGKVTEVLVKRWPGYGNSDQIRTHQIPQEWPEAVDKQIETQ